MPEKYLRISDKIEILNLSITTMETSYKTNLIICLTIFKMFARPNRAYKDIIVAMI